MKNKNNRKKLKKSQNLNQGDSNDEPTATDENKESKSKKSDNTFDELQEVLSLATGNEDILYSSLLIKKVLKATLGGNFFDETTNRYLISGLSGGKPKDTIEGMAISLIFICFNQSLDLMTISKNADHKVKGDNLKLSNKFIHAFSNLIKTLLDYRSKNGISKKLKTMKFDEYSSEFDRDIREKMNGKGKNDG